jgi:hypothetical protein
MAYGNILADVVQSSVTGTAPVFKDGTGNQTGTICRAWVNFTGSTAVINSSFNTSSITRTQGGGYTMTFTNAMPNANYAVVVSAYSTSTPHGVSCALYTTQTTTTVGLQYFYYDLQTDPSTYSVAIFA